MFSASCRDVSFEVAVAPAGRTGPLFDAVPARARLARPENETVGGEFLEMALSEPHPFALLALRHGDGRYIKLLRQLGRVDLLFLDD
jgi:hypothetical protein